MVRGVLSFILVSGLCSCAAQAGAKPSPAAPKVEAAPVLPTPPPAVPSPAAAPEVKAPALPQVDVGVDSPTLVIQKYTEELKKIVEPSKPKDKTKRDAQREKRIAEKVRQFFDFEGLAREALGHHWTRASAAQRNEYSDLFVTLIEDSYLRRTRDIVGDYQIVYGSEEIKGNRAKVSSRVIRSDADVEIRYDLHKKPKNWMIYNIDLDGVDLISNYQTQFNRIIQNEGFNGLLSRLRKKKNEMQKEVTF